MNMLAEPATTSKTLSEEAYARLRADLLACKFMPGERLRLESLREEYRVGFSPLREALTRLVGDGLVTIIGQKGFRVSPVSLYNAQDIITTRQRIDDLILPDALAHGDSAWEANIVASFHLLMKTPHFVGDDRVVSADWSQIHRSFHYSLIAAAPSRMLKQFWLNVFDQTDRYRRLAVMLGSHRRNESKEHTQLKDAVLARDVKRACDMSRVHNQNTLNVVREVLTETGAVVQQRTHHEPVLSQRDASAEKKQQRARARYAENGPIRKRRRA
jgi:GntR family transcriptional regulator, carbon starvation induced regulator